MAAVSFNFDVTHKSGRYIRLCLSTLITCIKNVKKRIKNQAFTVLCLYSILPHSIKKNLYPFIYFIFLEILTQPKF